MGYRCPVCDDPQSDGEHLANHLAFTAMLGDDDHERWLDEAVPEWERLDPPSLAERLVDDVEETTFPQVFEDTTDGGRDESASAQHGHGHDHGDAATPLDDRRVDASNLDADQRAILERAREMTRQHGDDPESDGGDSGRRRDDDGEDETE